MFDNQDKLLSNSCSNDKSINQTFDIWSCGFSLFTRPNEVNVHLFVQEKWLTLFGWFLSVATVAGNGFLIILIAQSRPLHTSSNWLVLSLAVADLGVGFVVFPLGYMCRPRICDMSVHWLPLVFPSLFGDKPLYIDLGSFHSYCSSLQISHFHDCETNFISYRTCMVCILPDCFVSGVGIIHHKLANDFESHPTYRGACL